MPIERQKTFIRIAVKDRDKLMNECVEIFLKAHPEMRGMKITQDFMIKKVIRYYIETDY